MLALTTVCCNAIESVEEINKLIAETEEKQDKAHQIAELARELGEGENHAVITYAKMKWQEQEKALKDLYIRRERASKFVYLGSFKISHYDVCKQCNGGNTLTATGKPLVPWSTIAVDPSVIPLNSKVYIDGYGMFNAHDTGGAIKGRKIDVCVNTCKEAYELGIAYKDVYIYKG